MNLIETISADFITAFKAKEMDKKNFLGLVKSEATKKDKTPSDDDVIGIIKSMVKKHTESVEQYNTPTLNEMELEVLNGYLPEQYSEDKISSVVSGILERETKHDMGFIMGMFQKEHGGKADNKIVSKIIREQLA